MLELLIGVAFAAVAVHYVLRPVFRPAPSGPGADPGHEAGGECERCGMGLQTDARFCSHCGASVSA